jgi:hypothetical protein
MKHTTTPYYIAAYVYKMHDVFLFVLHCASVSCFLICEIPTSLCRTLVPKKCNYYCGYNNPCATSTPMQSSHLMDSTPCRTAMEFTRIHNTRASCASLLECMRLFTSAPESINSLTHKMKVEKANSMVRINDIFGLQKLPKVYQLCYLFVSPIENTTLQNCRYHPLTPHATQATYHMTKCVIVSCSAFIQASL